MSRGYRGVLAVLTTIGLLCTNAWGQAAGRSGEGVVTNYVDPKQQTALWFGARSHWLQPWRAYLETLPASRLRNAVGINLNVDADQADAVCRHLAKNGFRKVRVEFGWGTVSWDNPKRLADTSRFDKIVSACKRWKLRPLFLLNAHHGAPCPVQFYNVRLLHPAKKGDQVVQLDPATTKLVVPGRSGLCQLTEYWAAEALFTSLQPDGAARLSRRLPKDLPAGDAPAATLKYLPFYPSRLKADGKVPREFEETMGGWLDYVEAITTEARRALGTEGARDAGFDLEVWNELTFGSNFLSINNYYDTPIAEGDWAWTEILKRTVDYVRDPSHNLPGVGVGDGFDNQWPWGSGTKAPAGLTALDKHPYAGVRRFPKDQGEPNGIRPLNALGQPDATSVGADKWKDTFVPTYVSHFPEYFLSAIQTEHMVRDISPITTNLFDVPHGRNTHPAWPDGRSAPAPGLWITEVNIDPNGADPGNLAQYTAGGQPPAAPGLTPMDAAHMQAKAILRYLVSCVNKGVDRFYFFAARDDNPMGLGLVSGSFFRYLKEHGNVYPQDDEPLTSPTMLAVRRLVAGMPGGDRLRRPRSLSLLEIADKHNHRQFEGDPATAGQNPNPRPPLFNRDVLGFFPYQASDNRFVVPVYVMTRNLAQLYKPAASAADVTRFDLPDERYRLTIGGVHGRGAKISLYDPLTGKSVPLHVLGAGADRVIVELPLTDSPRLLTITDTAPKPQAAVKAKPGASKP